MGQNECALPPVVFPKVTRGKFGETRVKKVKGCVARQLGGAAACPAPSTVVSRRVAATGHESSERPAGERPRARAAPPHGGGRLPAFLGGTLVCAAS